MSIEFTENTVGCWYVELGGGNNYLAALSKTPAGFHLDYRFRYSGSDPRPFEGNDTRSWYSGDIADHDQERVVNGIRATVNTLAAMAHSEVDEVMMNERGIKDFMRRFAAMPWANVRIEPCTDGDQ
jgi:hypothetical protein